MLSALIVFVKGGLKKKPIPERVKRCFKKESTGSGITSAKIIGQHNRTNNNMCEQNYVQKFYSAIFHMMTDERKAADTRMT